MTDGEGAFIEGLDLYYTSGTTGKSKGVMLTHGNIVVNALGHVAVISPFAAHTHARAVTQHMHRLCRAGRTAMPATDNALLCTS